MTTDGPTHCEHCRFPNAARATFCEQCGQPLLRTCPKCGARPSASARFCVECGTAQDAAGSSPSRLASPVAYTPSHLAERILTSRAAIEGERKQVTVLFADLRSSLELLTNQDPEEARRLLDAVVQHMMDAVHHYEGTVNQVLGDGIMALFGAPLGHEDHAVRASYAALRMQEQVRRFAENVWRSEGISIQIRVGLNSGEVVVRSISTDLHIDYSAIGSTTHLAARMQQLAVPGTILATGDTFRLVEGLVAVTPLGPITVKGLASPLNVYEITGPGRARSRFQAASGRGFTQFVGRESEMEQLDRIRRHLDVGHGQVVGIVGEPGVGKSRLLMEFTRAPDLEGTLVLESAATPYGRDGLHGPITSLLRSYFGLEDSDDPSTATRRVTDALIAIDEALLAIRPALLALLSVPVDDSGWLALDASQRRQRTLDAVRLLLFRESRRRPVVVVVDDVQWVDPETQALLDALVDTLPAARVMLLVAYRPEYQHAWANRASYTQLRLDRLSPSSVEALFDSLVGTDSSLAPLKEYLIERTEGNPFFLEECVRSFVETGVLIGPRGARRRALEVDGIHVPVPDTVEAVLAARIDRLSPEHKRLLQSAAVIGREVPFALLEAVTGEADVGTRPGLAVLQSGEFLYESRMIPDLQYMFKHALTQEVAYKALLQERRLPLHGQVVAGLERLYADNLFPHLDRLSYHAFRGELWEKAATYSRRAGSKAIARSASRQAVLCFEQALAALGHLEESRETTEQSLDVHLDLQSALVPLGHLERMLESLRAAERLAERLGEQSRLGRVYAYMAHCFWWSGEPARAVESCQRSLAIAAECGDSGLAMVSNVRLGQASFALGRYRQVVQACQAALDILGAESIGNVFDLPAMPAVVSLSFMGRCQALLGDFPVGVETAKQAGKVAEQAEHPYSMVIAYWALGDIYITQGRCEPAIGLLEQAARMCSAGKFALMVPIVNRLLGEAYCLWGRGDEGVRLLEGAVQDLAAVKYMPALPGAYASLSEGYLLAGRFGEALRAAQQARELSTAHEQEATEAAVVRILGEIGLARSSAPDETKAFFSEAWARAERLENRPLMARCALGLSRAERGLGEPGPALEHLGVAVQMLAEMGMTRWLHEAQAHRASLTSTE